MLCSMLKTLSVTVNIYTRASVVNLMYEHTWFHTYACMDMGLPYTNILGTSAVVDTMASGEYCV